MDARELRVFLAVVDHGGFRRGADALRLAQPSVSATVRSLERELGAELFTRVGRGVVPTAAARALIGPAREVLHDLEVAHAEVAAVQGLHGGRLDVASMPSQAVDPLAGTIARFVRRRPAVAVRVHAVSTAAACVAAVVEGRTELGLLATTGRLTDPDVVVREIGHQRFVLVAPAGSGLPRSVTAADLAGHRLVVGQPGTGMREVADALGTPVAVEVEHREAVLPLVLAGAGVAVVAEAWRDLAGRCGLAVHDLPDAAVLHLGWVSRPGHLTPAARALLADTITA